ncbi:hypothetical protein [uncultured Phascolarctobacterium sp.]|uniref:hypothetical protein n=1 Tax=uncultured Phascolarctobacterium sp. TaxID=512296 RepID=UPI0027D9BBBC|nr:hypothetical protein [uncultured Phascolarctobacterium sp.]
MVDIDSYKEERCSENKMNHSVDGLMVVCPICGREFGCNKTLHVYKSMAGRKRQYFCSYSCYQQRLHPKAKR